jgi:hypothetical protein
LGARLEPLGCEPFGQVFVRDERASCGGAPRVTLRRAMLLPHSWRKKRRLAGLEWGMARGPSIRRADSERGEKRRGKTNSSVFYAPRIRELRSLFTSSRRAGELKCSVDQREGRCFTDRADSVEFASTSNPKRLPAPCQLDGASRRVLRRQPCFPLETGCLGRLPGVFEMVHGDSKRLVDRRSTAFPVALRHST